MKCLFIALFFGLPLLVVWLTKGDRPFWEALVEGATRARRTPTERRADARLEELRGLPTDLEIDAYTFYFDPAFPSVRAEVLSLLAGRRGLAADFRWIFMHARRQEQLWAIDVLKDLRPLCLPELALAINAALTRIATNLHDTSGATIRPAPFQTCADWADRLVDAIAVLAAEGADCRPGLRRVIAAVQRCPETKARNALLDRANSALRVRVAATAATIER